MKKVDNSTWWSWCLTGLLMMIITARPVRSQPNDRNSTRFAFYCSQYKGMNEEFLSRNLNTTLSSLHDKLSINSVPYATARSLLNGDSVWGLASCRGYVSKADCVACFDYAVAQLRACGFANGGYVFYDDCDIRYENYNFYAEAKVRTASLQCNNASSTQQPEFRKTANELLSDLSIAVPRASNFYAASTRRIADGIVTVYAIGQCNLNLSQSACAECMGSRYTALDSCLPGSPGARRFKQEESHNWWSCWRDKSTGSTVLLQGPTRYSYDDLRKATNNFSDESKLGGGMFGKVYKGTLKNGDTVAIKKTFMTSTRGKIRIDDELKITCNVHHRHLIRLVGYCSKGPFLFLVHEYMENGSLDQESAYVAPEYAIHGQLSEKVDTYSFGIVVLEIISGKRCHSTKDVESVNQSLLDHAWNLYDSGTHLKLVDDTLDPSEYGEEEAKKIIEIALMCTQSPVSTRPAMSEIFVFSFDFILFSSQANLNEYV
ncbi:hypothetical protein L1987_37003 [Smallanthus sonchifolius]|uniref:Uncharacterized protein n=1 Tax=Smallanthus sonchifolius TaxID=185202 RepID=A0ACB9HFL1_9ASTR|nr:hypothetical protein L1987_37003 [Smallanthus sonchifolius]